MGFWAALGFLTTLPVPVRREFSAEEVGRSTLYFPLVGLLLGLILWLVDLGLSRILPVTFTNVLLLGLLAFLTGGMHVDGFIDSCDGLAARRTSQQRLDIMADSRVGAFGVIGGCLILLAQFAALSELGGTVRGPALVLAPVVGRWAMVYAIHGFPYARGSSGKGHAFKEASRLRSVLLASGICVAAALIATLSWRGVVVVGVGLGVTVLSAWYIRSRLGGLTGDSYGAINEIGQVTTLVVLPLLWKM